MITLVTRIGRLELLIYRAIPLGHGRTGVLPRVLLTIPAGGIVDGLLPLMVLAV